MLLASFLKYPTDKSTLITLSSLKGIDFTELPLSKKRVMFRQTLLESLCMATNIEDEMFVLKRVFGKLPKLKDVDQVKDGLIYYFHHHFFTQLKSNTDTLKSKNCSCSAKKLVKYLQTLPQHMVFNSSLLSQSIILLCIQLNSLKLILRYHNWKAIL